MSELIVDTNEQRVQIKTTDNQIIRGTINLLSDSAPMKRISDLFIKGENKFVVVYNASAGGFENAVIVINKSQIVWVMEEKKR